MFLLKKRCGLLLQRSALKDNDSCLQFCGRDRFILWQRKVSMLVGFWYLLSRVFTYMYLHSPSTLNRMWFKVILKQSKAGLNPEFFFFLTGYLICLLYYLHIAKETDRFVPFSRILAASEMPSASFRIWTLVPVLISYDDTRNANLFCL